MENKQNLRINGATDVGGGNYNKVVVRGKSTLSGDLNCVEFTTMGLSRVKGNLETVKANIDGKSTVEGILKSESLTVKGTTKIMGSADVEILDIAGSLDIKDYLSAGEIKVRGKLEVDGDCEADLFEVEGQFNIDGLLTADQINIQLHGTSQAKEIGGEKIIVKKEVTSKFKEFVNEVLYFFNFYNSAGKLTVESIEGDNIYLESTKVKVVRGTNVKIGPDCEIEMVEYKNKYQQDEESKVEETRQLG